MREFKLGDKVKLTSTRWGDSATNPIWGGSQGHISGIIDNITRRNVEVQWKNGSHNSYYKEDLQLLEEKIAVKQYGIVTFCNTYYK
jgi:hypothetical protein